MEKSVLEFYPHDPKQEGGLAEADHPNYRKAVPERPKRGYLKCPECKVQFRPDSLFMESYTLESYARFLLAYPFHERQARMNWDKVKNRLKDMGLANDFWEAWYRLKPQYYQARVE